MTKMVHILKRYAVIHSGVKVNKMKLIGEQELKELNKRIKEEFYEKLPINEIRVKNENNLKHIIKLGEVIAQEYKKKQMKVVAKWCMDVSKWYKEDFPMKSEAITEQTEREIGYSLQAIVDLSELKDTTHTNDTQTEGVLKELFEEKKNKVLNQLPKVIKVLQNKGDKQFWIEVHYNVIDFMEKLFSEMDSDMGRENTTEFRAKNYEILNTYLDDLVYYRTLSLPRMPNH